MVERAGLCSSIDMRTTLRQAPALSAAANGEERAEQIKNIQDRVERLRGAQKQIVTPVTQLTGDMRLLTRGADAAKPPATQPDTREFVRRDRAWRAAHPRTEVA